jgi:hypothetical protein
VSSNQFGKWPALGNAFEASMDPEEFDHFGIGNCIPTLFDQEL